MANNGLTCAEASQFRQNVRNMFQTIMEKHLDMKNPAIQSMNFAENIEKGIYNSTLINATKHYLVKKWSNPKIVELYKMRVYAIYINIHPNSPQGNSNLIERLANFEILPHQLGFMTPEELNPVRWQPLIEDKKKRDSVRFEFNKGAVTDQFKCSRCKNKSCVYYELQTRSADEPMTQYITCIECGHRWRQ